MSLLAQIEKDYEQAFRNKEVSAVSTLRLLLAALKNESIRKKGPLEEADIIKVIKSEIKKRKEAIFEYEKADRMELATGEKEEMIVLEKYLPQQMSEDDIRVKVKKIIEGLDDTANLGKVMGKVMAELKDEADGTLVRKIVEEEIT
jgi:uncharacterized protein